MSEMENTTTTPYDLLEISPRASEEVIKAAHEALTKKYNPDKKNEKKALEKLDEAREILLDKNKRENYDKKNENLVGKVIGDYKILELIAEGGFGKTYKGEEIPWGFPVCIKHANEISAEDEKILVEEALAIWDLRHYGIPAIRRLLKLPDKSLALVMSYIPGKTLEKIIKEVDSLDPESVCWIAERSLNILKYLHYNGVVHGDVKPKNVIIQPESHNIVLVDYGLSAIRPSGKDENKGYTPYFASPEQKKGKVLVPESDFYSLGMTMIYALGGNVETKKIPDSVPETFSDFIKRLIVYDVSERPNWEKEDLFDSLVDLRSKLFGRRHSGLKKIPGLDENGK
jgi:serine/threonine protein kinase